MPGLLRSSPSPSLCLDGVAPETAAAGAAVGPGAAATAARSGGHRPDLAAALRVALGSQESCSQGARRAALQLAAEAAGIGLRVGTDAAWCGPTPAPSPADMGGLAPAAEAAAAQLARLQLHQAGAAAAAAAASVGSPAPAGLATVDAAMLAVDDVAQYLAD